MEQDVVASLQAALRQGALEQILHREALEHHGRACVEVDGVGQFADVFSGHDTRFAIASGRRTGIRSAVAGFQMRDALTHSFHHARGFHAQTMRHGQRVQTGAVVDVDEIQTHGFVANANFTGTGVAHAHVHQMQFVGATGFVEMNGFAHVCLL